MMRLFAAGLFVALCLMGTMWAMDGWQGTTASLVTGVMVAALSCLAVWLFNRRRSP